MLFFITNDGNGGFKEVDRGGAQFILSPSGIFRAWFSGRVSAHGGDGLRLGATVNESTYQSIVNWIKSNEAFSGKLFEAWNNE